MARKCSDQRPQTNPRHRKEEAQNTGIISDLSSAGFNVVYIVIKAIVITHISSASRSMFLVKALIKLA